MLGDNHRVTLGRSDRGVQSSRTKLVAGPLGSARNFRLLCGVRADARDAKKVAESIDGCGALRIDPLKHGVDVVVGHWTSDAKGEAERRAGSGSSWEDGRDGWYSSFR